MKKILIILLTLALVLTFAACGASAKIDPVTMNIAVLKGPTGMGMAKMLQDNYVIDKNITANVTISSAPDEVAAKLIKGEIDIAAVPTNLAATLYNKTGGKIQIAAINTLGNLFVLTNGEDIKSLSDLAGKTVYISGQGATPEYVVDYILDKAGIKDKVKIVFATEHSELATLIASGKASIAVLPEPFVSTVTAKNTNVKIAINLNDEWNKVSGGNAMAMGCIVVNKAFAEKNKAAVNEFLKQYEESVNFVNKSTDEAAAIIASKGILASAELAKKAIPTSAIVYKDAYTDKTEITSFLTLLYNYNPASIGGKLPNEDFYYQK
ncbi:MAG: ABC transporter substrate-binding protein [Eubacteriaceae bacterium]|nr:ABC transporter substrate-binding protein [Eubacteriaceae bacterium]